MQREARVTQYLGNHKEITYNLVNLYWSDIIKLFKSITHYFVSKVGLEGINGFHPHDNIHEAGFAPCMTEAPIKPNDSSIEAYLEDWSWQLVEYCQVLRILYPTAMKKPFTLPRDRGFLISREDTKFIQVFNHLNEHHPNRHISGEVSWVYRFSHTNALRHHNVESTHLVGLANSAFDIIPPRSKSFTVSGHCSFDCFASVSPSHLD